MHLLIPPPHLRDDWESPIHSKFNAAATEIEPTTILYTYTKEYPNNQYATQGLNYHTVYIFTYFLYFYFTLKSKLLTT